jgi:hypothetical protein
MEVLAVRSKFHQLIDTVEKYRFVNIVFKKINEENRTIFWAFERSFR